MSSHHSTKYVVYEILEPQVLKAVYRNDIATIHMPEAVEIIVDRLAAFPGDYYVIIVGDGTNRFAYETWDYLLTTGTERLIAIAMVVTDTDAITTAAFFLTQMEKDIPVEIFGSEEKALDWIHGLKDGKPYQDGSK
jgi:hypothetical protein